MTPRATLSLLLLITPASLLLALGSGSMAVDLWAVLGGGGDALAQTLILDLRLPRALSAFTTGALLALAPERGLHGLLFWLMGDLGHAPPPLWGLLVMALGLGLCMPLARNLNVLSRGELAAAALGVMSRGCAWRSTSSPRCSPPPR